MGWKARQHDAKRKCRVDGEAVFFTLHSGRKLEKSGLIC
jgi:hypothetical protein